MQYAGKYELGLATSGSAGFDLRAEHDFCLEPGGTALVGTGISAAIPAGHVGLLFARSSLPMKYGLTLANGVGVIDSDYRGEIKAAVHNFTHDTITGIKAGTRIAQLVIVPIDTRAEKVDILEETARGAGGFGSTGQ